MNPQVSTETLLFFRQLLEQVQISAGSEDFEQQAQRIIAVRRDLDNAIQATLPRSE